MSHDNVLDHIPLIDSIDAQIVMHCQVHFSGDFNEMLTYYKKKGVGCMSEFSIKRIKQIAIVEQQALDLLPLEAKESIKQAKKLYLDLRMLYEESNTPKINIAIADLILTEDENPKKEMDALIVLKETSIPALRDLLSSSTFYDPLNPGYGRAPIFAATLLGIIKDITSLPVLLNALGNGYFSVDEAVIDAICSFGALAKPFLLQKLQTKPYCKDNERAAIVLSAFPEDVEIALSCLTLLVNPSIRKNLSFAPYLVFPCQALESIPDRALFKTIASENNTPSFIRNEMEIVIKRWGS
ncbi:MAG: hypothetical protein HY860_04165 [Chlamydiales bacterium]|nr:hypothetical protein [Chlamydiales bacterium]